MVELEQTIKNVYFLGIGGIGMSALARYFKAKGYKVAGYDRTLSALTQKMQAEEEIRINYIDEEEEIPAEFRDKTTTLVVYTPAIPGDNRQRAYFVGAGFDLHKRAEVLGMISRKGKAICVAGTHGKTTVSTLTAFLLKNSTVGCNAFLGGIAANFGTNLLLDRNSSYIVIEADEFDRSFLHLSPEIAVITAMDEDHLDIYENKANLLEAFEAFAGQVNPQGGRLFLKKGLQLKQTQVTGYYGVEVKADCYADGLRIEQGRYVFDYHGRGVDIEGWILGIPGRLNVENATAAITLALEAGVQPEEIRRALPDFKGVARRFNIQVYTEKTIYIDDYAHHPREIEATLRSVREMWPDRPVTVVFQPHLYTRTRDFQEDFARSLSLADRVVLLEIYPARERPIPGITAEVIRKRLTVPGNIVTKEELLQQIIPDFQGGILVTMGAGDIDRLVGEIGELVKGIRNLRTEMDVPPSRKAKVFIVSEDKALCETFESMKKTYQNLISASEIDVQSDKAGIEEDAVSVVIPGAVVYMPLEDLVDMEKEKERLLKEEERLKKELARSHGMLNNEKFVSKAPAAKIQEEKDKLAKYEQMMATVQERLAQMK